MGNWIELLTEELFNDFREFRKEYDFGDISEFERIKVVKKMKHILIDAVSILDYISMLIREKYPFEITRKGKQLARKTYFPYASEKESEQDFIKRVENQYLGIDEKTKNIIVKYQYFGKPNNWLRNLKKITTQLKHITFFIYNKVPQKTFLLSSKDCIYRVRGNIIVEKKDNKIYLKTKGYTSTEIIKGNITFDYSKWEYIIGDGRYNILTHEIKRLEIKEATTEYLTFLDISRNAIGTVAESVARVRMIARDFKGILY